MPENSPIFEEQTLTSDMRNFLEEWGLPLEGDIQESFKPETPPSAMQQLEELEPTVTMTREQAIDELTQMQQAEGYVPAKAPLNLGQEVGGGARQGFAPDEATPEQHIVEQGDTLSQIAEGLGLDMNQLAELNQIQDPNKIQVGQILNLIGLGDQQPQTQEPVSKIAPYQADASVESYDFIGEQDTPSKGVTKPPEPITKTAPHQKGVKEEDVLIWNDSTKKFESGKKSPAKWMKTLANQIMGMPKEDVINVLSFMPIPAIAGATVPIKAIQAWLKSQRGRSKVMRMGEADKVTLGATEKGLVDDVRDFVQQIFMQKGLEKTLKKGIRYGGEAGRDFVVKGPITRKELKILTNARSKY